MCVSLQGKKKKNNVRSAKVLMKILEDVAVTKSNFFNVAFGAFERQYFLFIKCVP